MVDFGPVVQEEMTFKDISCLELGWPLCIISLNMKITLLLEIIKQDVDKQCKPRQNARLGIILQSALFAMINQFKRTKYSIIL